jgi:excisionase family DNA binding protein
MSPLMTYQEAAGYLRIPLATIDRMVRANELSSVLIRGRRLFRIRDLDAYIRSHSIPGCGIRQRAATTPTARNERSGGRYGCLDQL